MDEDSKDNYADGDSSDFFEWTKKLFEARKAKGAKLGEKRNCFVCKKESVLKCKDCSTLHKIDGRRVPFYCGKEHQLIHWKSGHKKACNRYGGMQTVVALAYAVYKNHLPGIGGPEYNDYGFANCKTMSEEKNLGGLYTGLINRIKCDLDDLHEACMNGRLDTFIITEYEAKIDPAARGGYYPWFLDNQHIVKNIVPGKIKG